MILVILPLGKAAKDIWYWVARVVMYTIASALGAASLAFLLGLVGSLLNSFLPNGWLQWAVALLGIASLLYAGKEMGLYRLPNPQIGWQVPKSWQGPSRTVGQTLYGYVLGMGIWTFIPFTSFYIVLAWELVAGAMSLQAAVMIGLVYGLARGIPTVAGGISMLRDEYPLPVTDWLINHLGWWHAINAFALLVVGAFLLGTFVI